MRAFTPPRADLRGGNQSEDSFAMSRRIFAPSATLVRLFAVRFERSKSLLDGRGRISSHRFGSPLLPAAPGPAKRRFWNMVLSGMDRGVRIFLAVRGPRYLGADTAWWYVCNDRSAEILLCHEDDPRPSHLTLNIPFLYITAPSTDCSR